MGFAPLPAGDTAVYTAASGQTIAYFRRADWLGSSRLASTGSGALYYDGAYAPYGENYAETGTIDHSFTGQNQDTVGDLYDFLYREYHPTQGRWISPDPAGILAVDATNPQSWNRYAYAGNNPMTNVDPDGQDYYLRGGAICGEQPEQCDDEGYLIDDSGSRVVITDQQVLNGEVGSTVGENGVDTITTDQGTFQAEFFDNAPTTVNVSGAPGSNVAAVATNFGLDMWDQIANLGNTSIAQLTVGQYSLNLPNVPGGHGGAAFAGQALAFLLPMIVFEDGTGKVHEKLPSLDELKTMTKDDLRYLAEELQKSLSTRRVLMFDMGPEAGHAARIRQEERLLRAIGKILSGS